MYVIGCFFCKSINFFNIPKNSSKEIRNAVDYVDLLSFNSAHNFLKNR